MSKNAKKVRSCRECPIMIMAPYAQGTAAKNKHIPLLYVAREVSHQ